MKSIVDFTNLLKSYFASNSALANVKNGTTDIVQTSADGCTVVGGIGKNTYFYLDGELVRAKTAIANGASFTENTNYEVPNKGAYNEINSSVNTMQNNGLGTGVSILNYTSSNQYTTPSDGYIYLKSGDDINDYVIVEIGDRLDVGVKTQQAGYPEYNAIYVRKGVTAYVLAKSGSTVTAGFRPYQ